METAILFKDVSFLGSKSTWNTIIIDNINWRCFVFKMTDMNKSLILITYVKQWSVLYWYYRCLELHQQSMLIALHGLNMIHLSKFFLLSSDIEIL